MASLRAFAIALSLIIGSTVYASTAPPTLLWDYSVLKEVKSNLDYHYLVEECVKKANAFLGQPPLTVMDKTWSFNDDYHYYATMAGYWWPEEKDGKIVYVRHDGKSYPGANDLDLKKIQQLAARLQYFSLAYYFTHKRKYLKAFQLHLDTWFVNMETRMYPNFEYAQVIPGKKEIKGRGVGLIEAHPFNTILESIRLLETVKPIGRERKKKLIKWFSDFANWMVDSELGKIDRKANSNQSVSYDVTLLNIAAFTGKDSLANEIIREFPERRIKVQILEDGRLLSEINRTNAYTYSLANLNFFVQFCIIAKSLGVDVFHQNENRLVVALQYISSFIDRPEEFPYQQINGWKSARKNLYVVVNRFKRLDANIDDKLSLNSSNTNIQSIDDLLFL